MPDEVTRKLEERMTNVEAELLKQMEGATKVKRDTEAKNVLHKYECSEMKTANNELKLQIDQLKARVEDLELQMKCNKEEIEKGKEDSIEIRRYMSEQQARFDKMLQEILHHGEAIDRHGAAIVTLLEKINEVPKVSLTVKQSTVRNDD